MNTAGKICLSIILFIGAMSFGVSAEDLSRDFTVSKNYLAIPIENGAKKCRLLLSVDGETIRNYETELATSSGDIDWWAFFTIERYKGKPASVKFLSKHRKGFELIRQTDSVPGSDKWYSESLRPQFHFSQKVGWNNDVNGTVYYDGEWHLFFQHNPVGIRPANMTWGHAISKDLIHWEQQPNAVLPRTMARGVCFSGSGVVDKKNTAGFKTGTEDVIVLCVTDKQKWLGVKSLAYSNDRGRTFTWYEGNPVLKDNGNDPRVLWYEYNEDDEPLNSAAKQYGGHWVMVVQDYDHRAAALHTSTDLKNWTVRSFMRGYGECPELFKLNVDGEADNTRWIMMGGDAKYTIGQFDGRTFTPEHEKKYQVHYGNYYASQTFSNQPDGGRIQMGWVRSGKGDFFEGMPFSQTFTFPHRLTLRNTGDGIRLFAEPIREIEKLHKKTHIVPNKKMDLSSAVDLEVPGQLFDIRAIFEVGDAEEVGLDIGGETVVYNAKSHRIIKPQIGNRIIKAHMKPVDGKVWLQVLVDRSMMEIVGNRGRVYITTLREPGEVLSVRAFAKGGDAKLVNLEVHELKSIWKKDSALGQGKRQNILSR